MKALCPFLEENLTISLIFSFYIHWKGIRRLAEPRELLSKRYQQFQRRLARHYINNMEDNNTDSNNDNNDNNTNITSRANDTRGGNGNRNENGGQGVRPRDGTRTGPRTNSGIDVENGSRVPLSGLPIADTDRRTHSGSTAPGNVRSVNMSSSGTHVRATAPATNSTFQIFSDHAVGENVQSVLTENSNWRNLDTQENKKKENSGSCKLLIISKNLI